MRKLYAGLPARVVVHTYVYPGFDNIVARNPKFGLWLRDSCTRPRATRPGGSGCRTSWC